MCTAPAWDSSKTYMTGDKVSRNGKEYVAKFYTVGQDPETNHEPQSGPATGAPWAYPTNC
jgi:chitodextrinase